MLVLSAPLLLFLCVMIRLTSPGPVVFRQKRLGRYGREFSCLKFRSMRADAEQVLRQDPALYREYFENDYKLPPERDPRITPIGRWLRKTSLDELPQLFNVLRGEMSLVGPRPVVPPEIEEYGDRAEEFLSVLPGVTGAWQVSGRSELPYPERADVELAYVREWSLWLDIQILFKTAIVVLKREGAH